MALLFSFATVLALHWKMQPAILRAETAYYQVIAHTSPEHERTLIRGFWKQSSHGHYTPLAFTMEFIFAKHVGLRPNLWRARQFFLASLLALVVFGLTRAAAEQTGAPPLATTLMAAAISIIFMAQPMMRSLLEWPFHALQVGWMILAVATGWMVVGLPRAENKGSRFWLIAVIAYSSMHVLGLGLAVVTGTLGVFSLMLIGALTGYFPQLRPHLRPLVASTVFLTLFGFLHTVAMVLLNNAPAGLGSNHLPDWHEFIGLCVLLPINILAGLFSAQLDLALIDNLLHSLWPVGAAVLLSIGLFVAILVKRSRQKGLSQGALYLSLFSGVMLVTIVAMIAARELREPNADGFSGYLIGPRYVLPISVCWLGLGLSPLMLLSPRRLSFIAAVSCLLAIGAIMAHRSYETYVAARTAPLHGASHIQLWQDLVEIAREARAADLPIPNLPLKPLCGFEFIDFKYLEPLLHDELKLPANDHNSYLDWTECRDHRLDEYLTKCPTLLRTARLLDLDLPISNHK